MQQTLAEVLQSLPVATVLPPAENRAAWEKWQEGLRVKFTLLDPLPPLRMVLVLVQRSINTNGFIVASEGSSGVL
ncbi:hypothetical protein ACFFLM_00990, partial [Deinococcus oregonensis]